MGCARKTEREEEKEEGGYWKWIVKFCRETHRKPRELIEIPRDQCEGNSTDLDHLEFPRVSRGVALTRE